MRPCSHMFTDLVSGVLVYGLSNRDEALCSLSHSDPDYIML